jgi:hypothetical protein
MVTDTIATQLTIITVTIRTCTVADSLMVVAAAVEVEMEEEVVVILTDRTVMASVVDLGEATISNSPMLRTTINKT